MTSKKNNHEKTLTNLMGMYNTKEKAEIITV